MRLTQVLYQIADRCPPRDDDDKFGGPHSGITLFVYLDGHVAPVSDEIEDEVLLALSTIAGSEVVQQ